MNLGERWPLLPLAAAAVLAVRAWGGVQYVDVSAARGIGLYRMAAGMAGGVAAEDFDDDGDIDLFVPNRQNIADQLYRNLGDGNYENIAAAAGVASTSNSRAGLWFDYDGDHDLDLVVARDRWWIPTYCSATTQPGSVPTTLVLYQNNGNATFTDVTTAAGLFGDLLCCELTHTGGIAAGDINNDGWLDLCLTQWDGYVWLWLNDTDGTFTDISATSGVGPNHDDYWQPLMHDFDGDGWTDIFIAEDFEPDRLWINQHDNTFVDAAPTAGLDNDMNDMGIAPGDYDNDGDLDLYVTNIVAEPSETEVEHNVLHRNDSVGGSLAFTEVSQAAGVDQGYWGWGTTFLDADNDGRLDLAATNGFCGTGFTNDPSRFFANLGGDPVTFQEVSSTVGVSDTNWGSCFIAFDHDRDGGLDLLQTCNLNTGVLRLRRNVRSGDALANHYLVVKPRLSGPNHWAIGSIVRVTAGSQSMMRLVTAGTSLMGQEPAEAFFGLGTATSATVEVEWPDGATTTLANVGADQIIVVTNCPGDLDGSGAVGFNDLTQILLGWGPCPPACPLDLDGSGNVGFGDLTLLLIGWGPCD